MLEFDKYWYFNFHNLWDSKLSPRRYEFKFRASCTKLEWYQIMVKTSELFFSLYSNGHVGNLQKIKKINKKINLQFFLVIVSTYDVYSWKSEINLH